MPLLIVGSLLGCALPAGTEPSETADRPRPTASAPPLERLPDETFPPITGEVPHDLLARVVADAAVETDADPESIDLLIAEAVVWNDGSLGCPEPGMSYTMQLVPGYRVVVEADGHELAYHASDDGQLKLCEGQRPPSGG